MADCVSSDRPLPPKTGEVVNNHSDSRIWNSVVFRPGDIIIGTYAKSGTTWMQQIVRNLLADIPDEELISNLTPWVDFRILPPETVSGLEEQKHRRFMKTHLPLNNLPQSSMPCYIYIVRDGRDVVWSWYNHHKSLTNDVYSWLNSGEFDGPKFPVFDEDGLDEVAYFERWLQRDGYPLWNFYENIRSWWTVRDHPRVLLVHFENMKKDLRGEITRIYRFLRKHGDVKKGPENEIVEAALAKSTFKYMKSNASAMQPGAEIAMKGGAKSFINKGTNNRWKNVLPEELSEKYEEKIVDELGKECAHWVMTGEDYYTEQE